MNGAAHSEQIDWLPTSASRPDDDETVMIAAVDLSEPVWLGYHDGSRQQWYSVEGDNLTGHVTHWARMPAGPRS